jgi:hypothetical protein
MWIALFLLMGTIDAQADGAVTLTVKKILPPEYGYVRILVEAQNDNDGKLGSVTSDCTAFGADDDPVGTGAVNYYNLESGSKAYDEAIIEVGSSKVQYASCSNTVYSRERLRCST